MQCSELNENLHRLKQDNPVTPKHGKITVKQT
jgi:hypothetical protein